MPTVKERFDAFLTELEEDQNTYLEANKNLRRQVETAKTLMNHSSVKLPPQTRETTIFCYGDNIGFCLCFGDMYQHNFRTQYPYWLIIERDKEA